MATDGGARGASEDVPGDDEPGMTVRGGEGSEGPFFVGRHRHSVDDKRRVAIPKAVREAIDVVRDGAAFVVVRGMGDPCLWLMPERAFERFVKSSLRPMLERQAGVGSKDVRGLMRVFLSSADRVEADKQGRIVLDDEKCRRVGIGTEAVFAGVGERVEIWDPKRLGETENDEDFDRRARELFG